MVGRSKDMKSNRRIEISGWQRATTGLRVAAETESRVFEPLKGRLRQVQIGLPGHRVELVCRITATFLDDVSRTQIGRDRSLDGSAWRQTLAERAPAVVRCRVCSSGW